MRRICSFMALAGLGALATLPVAAEVVLDGRLGPAGALSGPDFRIGAELGRQEGANLFHSFRSFGLDPGQQAIFSGPSSIARIIGRVTGGQPSAIDGTIASTIVGADLYLINPSGLVFGPEASVDVSGSFFASTADRLLLSDGGRFEIRDPDASVLTSAPPAAFGFLTERPAAIAITGSTLGVQDGRRLEFVGGDIRISDTTLSGPGGDIRLAAARGPASIEAGGAVPAPDPGSGTVEIARSTLDASADGGGRVLVRGGRLVLRDNLLFAQTLGAGAGGRIDLFAAESVEMDGGYVSTGSQADGAGGVLSVTAPAVSLVNGAQLDASSFADGPAGSVAVTASRSVSLSGRRLAGFPFRSAIFASAGDGPGGLVSVATPELSLSDGARIDTGSYGAGAGGRIDIGTGRLILDRGGRLFGGTEASGAGGAINIDADAVTISGQDEASEIPRIDRSGIFVNSGKFFGFGSEFLGDAGHLSLASRSVEVTDGGRIEADSSGPGRVGGIALDTGTLVLSAGGQISNSNSGIGAPRGGDIRITATQGVDIIGFEADDPAQFRSGLFSDAIGGSDAGAISVEAPVLVLDGGRITVDTTGPGKAGSVTVRAGHVVLRNEGQIFAGTDGTGDGGDIDLHAGLLEITGIGDAPTATPVQGGAATGLFSNVKQNGSGRGGTIRVTADEARLANNGEISVRTSGTGPAGSLVLDFTGLVQMEGANIEAAVTDDESLAGPATERTTGGSITLTAGSLNLGPGSTIQSRSLRGPGQAGDIRIDIRDGLSLQRATITTETREGDGGNIGLRIGRLLDLNQAAITTSVAGGLGRGGNIDIDPPLMVLDRSRIEANAFGGPGGNIRILAGQLITTPDAVIQASSERSIDGDIEIAAPEIDIGSTLVVLPEVFLNADDLLRDECAGRGDGQASSLIDRGRGGLPPDPAGRLPSPPTAAPPAGQGSAADPPGGMTVAFGCSR